MHLFFGHALNAKHADIFDFHQKQLVAAFLGLGFDVQLDHHFELVVGFALFRVKVHLNRNVWVHLSGAAALRHHVFE